ncbi:MAG: TetR/AcrR family transcriptional regulator [Gammaproteobacteria bacterium]
MAPSARREQLLACALRTFAAKGLGETRHTDLAQAAGVALPTTFHYYPTRGELTEAVLDEVSRFLLDDIVAPHSAAATPAAVAIEQILMTFCDAMETHPDHVRVWLEWSVALRDALWQRYQKFYRGALAAIGRLLARGVDDGSIAADLDRDAAARVIVGLAHMIVQMRLSGSTRAQVDHTVRSLIRGYLQPK